MSVLLYPVHLFDLKYIPKEWKKYQFYLLEEPIYWGTDRQRRLNMSQLKLVLHRATMKYYYQLLREKGYRVKYMEEKDLRSGGYKFLKRDTNEMLYTYDPTDHLLVDKLDREADKYGKTVTIYETPNFLLTEEDLEEYLAKKKKDRKDSGKVRYSHSHFYRWSKKTLGLDKVLGSKTYDAENRKPLPDKIEIPALPSGDEGSGYVKEAIQYIKKRYGGNYGQAEDFYLPVTHQSSRKWFEAFLKKRFSNFGDYQDAITDRDPFVFHSVITPMLNIGLLDPQWVVDRVVVYYQQNKGKGGLEKNDFEGYLRQIIGWREYSRMLYLYVYDEIKDGNYFNHQRRLTQKWYRGELGIRPVDWTIQTAFQTGYLHHILRLMMMANFMNLCQLHPHDVYRWFMEFSLDSYDWVMTNNVYSMGLYADGGLTMRKPYLSSSNYIRKMSDFSGGDWEEVWDALFYRFLIKNEKKLAGTPYVRNLFYFKKKSRKERDRIIRKANSFIRSVTKK